MLSCPYLYFHQFKNMQSNTWSERDKAVVWHPFSHQWKEELPITIVKGEGSLLYDDNGKAYIDAISSWWVNLHGHAHPYMAQKISEQLYQLEHSIFAGFTHPGAIELSERLLDILPTNQAKVFFSDNGSTAVEVAIKMVMQYWWNRGKSKKVFLALEDSYHGDTFGAMAVGQPSPFNAPFEPAALEVIHLPRPDEHNMSALLSQISRLAEEKSVAAFIFEPLVQGSGGMQMYQEEFLEQLIQHCQHLDILTIADEVMTGFGRTGAFFACDHMDVAPDLFCLSKGLTGGYLPMGITTCTERIYSAFTEKDVAKTFYHGHSYTGNPLACAAALASLDLLTKPGYIDEVVRIVYKQQAFFLRMKDHLKLRNVRQTGTILAMDVVSDAPSGYFNGIRDSLYDRFIQRGVLLRPLGNVVYVLPPFSTTNDQLDIIHGVIEEVLEEV
jgi:adenosylmethionine---8-amino-7-oxononanoate aminotransferase